MGGEREEDMAGNRICIIRIQPYADDGYMLLWWWCQPRTNPASACQQYALSPTSVVHVKRDGADVTQIVSKPGVINQPSICPEDSE